MADVLSDSGIMQHHGGHSRLLRSFHGRHFPGFPLTPDASLRSKLRQASVFEKTFTVIQHNTTLAMSISQEHPSLHHHLVP
jgi:hypothetical protein